ncbi:CAP domain-containing protein [uncultured Polaribacter sp.]|uniref:CAP domain-containing protein n=1 Tax=uncultured Polaribacter sp. TaxID=174711 RepID=UPI0026266AA2|nr:CAP domain-containing protein [uncultured Polaribacter sp.]
MRHLLKHTILFFLFAATISCNSTDSMEEENESSITNLPIENEILQLINDYRTEKNLAVLEKLDAIKTQTDIHTDYMIEKNKISHDLFSDRSSYLKTNANAKAVAENVANGYTTAKALVDGWIGSDGHRKNIEGNFTHFHLTAKQNSSNVWYYTNIFVRK